MKKAKPLHKHLFKNLHKVDRKGDVNEETKYDRYDKEKKKFAKADQKMKHGKNWKQFTKDVDAAKNRLRRGEVKKWDPAQKKYVSNKN